MEAICVKDYGDVKKGTIVNVQDDNTIYYNGKYVCKIYCSAFEVYDKTAGKVFEALGLEEGKVYSSDRLTCLYRVRGGILEAKHEGGWEESVANMNAILRSNFTEVEIPFEERIGVMHNYYVIDVFSELKIKKMIYSNSETDRAFIKNGNFFETRENAEETLEEFKLALKKGECN